LAIYLSCTRYYYQIAGFFSLKRAPVQTPKMLWVFKTCPAQSLIQILLP
jgi:hypothetical protein